MSILLDDVRNRMRAPFLSVYLGDRSDRGAIVVPMPGDRIGNVADIARGLLENPSEEAARIFDDAEAAGFCLHDVVVTVWRRELCPPDGPEKYWEYAGIDSVLTEMMYGSPAEQRAAKIGIKP